MEGMSRRELAFAPFAGDSCWVVSRAAPLFFSRSTAFSVALLMLAKLLSSIQRMTTRKSANVIPSGVLVKSNTLSCSALRCFSDNWRPMEPSFSTRSFSDSTLDLVSCLTSPPSVGTGFGAGCLGDVGIFACFSFSNRSSSADSDTMLPKTSRKRATSAVENFVDAVIARSSATTFCSCSRTMLWARCTRAQNLTCGLPCSPASSRLTPASTADSRALSNASRISLRPSAVFTSKCEFDNIHISSPSVTKPRSSGSLSAKIVFRRWKPSSAMPERSRVSSVTMARQRSAVRTKASKPILPLLHSGSASTRLCSTSSEGRWPSVDSACFRALIGSSSWLSLPSS
mmetsp:Transcript_31328/g.79802  ORF Transcript_31328/g.79802 Transcript_31328/m.79802 type:complete len:343 (+) Transcript_31328:236-1264(+)